MKLARALVLLVVCVSSVLAQPATLAERMKAAVLRLDATRIHAMQTAHLDGLMELMTDDCLYAHSTGRTQTKAELLAALKSGDLKYHSIKYEQLPAVRVYGEGTAVLTGVTAIDAEMKGARLQRKLLVTAIYVTQAMQWRLASYHSTTVPEPAPAK
jgi:uncharacterized protein (TIGR02246 family)